MRMINYAKAIFEIAVSRDKLNNIDLEFEQLKDYLKSYPKWVYMMDSPMISISEKYQYIDAFEFDASFLAFLKVLAKHNDLHMVDEIYEQWLQLIRAHQKIAHIHLYTAKPLSELQLEKFKNVLAPRFLDRTISLHVVIDETLLGGIKTVYHGQALDRSIAKELEELYTTI